MTLHRALSRALLPWVALLWLSTSAAVAWYMQHELTEQLDAGLHESAQRLLNLAAHDAAIHTQTGAPAPDLLSVPHRKPPGIDHDVLMYQVVDAQRRLLLRSADSPEQPLDLPLLTGYHDTDTLRIYTLAHPKLPLFIHIGDPLAHRRAALTETVLGLVLPLLVILPLLGLLIHAVTRRQLAPVATLAAELRQRDGHHLAPLAAKGLPAELQAIADSANHLLQRLSDALDTERALAANAAHELRTPLATVRLHLQAALDPAAPAQTHLHQALEALDRLSRRCTKLLQLSRAESGAALGRDRVDLVALSALVVQEFWGDSRLLERLQLQIPEDADVWVRGDPDILAIALRNLIENAVRYAPQGPIVVEVDARGQVRVVDSGPGIPAGQLHSIQDRHVRDSGRQRHSPDSGFGLGLSIVTAIVDRQGGRLELQSPPPGQATGLWACLVLVPDHRL